MCLWPFFSRQEKFKILSNEVEILRMESAVKDWVGMFEGFLQDGGGLKAGVVIIWHVCVCVVCFAMF